MTDTVDRKTRSAIMAKVHSANTTPEIYVRKLLHGMGYRFRIHVQNLPGKPDIVLPKYKSVIFVNGCFWHGCPRCKHAQIRPNSNSDYWNKKLDRNIERDKENINKLHELGWNVLVIWECETKRKNRDYLIEKICTFLGKESPPKEETIISD